jgi:TRAP-type transport system small permease protein
MKLGTIARKLDSGISGLSSLFNLVGVCVLMVMMFLVAIDVFLRYAFNAPLEGTYEAVELMMAVVFCFGIGYTQRQKGHVSVDLVTSKLGAKPRAALGSLVALLSLCIFIMMTWQSFVKAGVALKSGETSYGGVGPFGHVVMYPFIYLTSAACLIFCLELLVNLVSSLRDMAKK